MVSHQLDLNCDLGEGESPEHTRSLMRQITSANVACGGHAGDEASMTLCVQLAREFDVNLGAHPGLPNRDDFGRGAIQPSAHELSNWVIAQANTLQGIAREHGVVLHHIKLHGALYHAAESDAELATAYADTVRRHFHGTKIYARSGGLVAHAARQADIEAFEELFVDRAYLPDGKLVPRDAANALIADATQANRRLQHWIESGHMETVGGGMIKLEAQTLCIHGDTPCSLAMADLIRQTLSIRK